MNGGEQKIFDAINDVKINIAKIQTKQEERHNENIKKLDHIFAHINNCPINEIDIIRNEFKRLDKRLWAIIIIVVGSAIKVLFIN